MASGAYVHNNDRKLKKSMENYRKLYKVVKNCRKLLNVVENYSKLYKIDEECTKFVGNCRKPVRNCRLMSENIDFVFTLSVIYTLFTEESKWNPIGMATTSSSFTI